MQGASRRILLCVKMHLCLLCFYLGENARCRIFCKFGRLASGEKEVSTEPAPHLLMVWVQ